MFRIFNAAFKEQIEMVKFMRSMGVAEDQIRQAAGEFKAEDNEMVLKTTKKYDVTNQQIDGVRAPRKTLTTIAFLEAEMAGPTPRNYDEPPSDDESVAEGEDEMAALARRASKESSKLSSSRTNSKVRMGSKVSTKSRSKERDEYEDQQKQYWHMSDREVYEAIAMMVNAQFRDWIQHPLFTDDPTVEEEAKKEFERSESKERKKQREREEKLERGEEVSSVSLQLNSDEEDDDGFTTGMDDGFTTGIDV